MNELLDPVETSNTQISKCNHILQADLVEKNLIDSEKNSSGSSSSCLEVFLHKLIQVKQSNESVKAQENDLNNQREKCYQLVTGERTKSAQHVLSLLDDCLNEPLNRLYNNESKCRNLKEDFVSRELRLDDNHHSECLKVYLRKLISFKQSQTEQQTKETELIKTRLDCEREIQNEKFSIKRMISSLDSCLDEPVNKLDQFDSKCSNLNDTVANILTSMSKNQSQNCVQSYVVHVANTNLGGRFLIWKRKTDTLGWLKISDQPTKSYANLVKNYQNVYLLFLDKFKGF